MILHSKIPLLAAAMAAASAACSATTVERAAAGDAATAQSDAGSDGADVGRPEAPPADLLISLADGSVMWWRSDGTFVRELEGRVEGPAFGMGYDASSTLYVTHGYTQDLADGNAIETFDANAHRVGTFGAAYDCNPHSIVFDDLRRAFVGQADCNADILQLDEAGGVLDSFDVATEKRGVLSIALADEHCTVLYVSQSVNVKRYDVCARAQLPDFNQAPLPADAKQGSGANDLELVAGGGLLVANFTEIVGLDAVGNRSKVYDVEGPDGWRDLDLDSDGTSFWAVNYSTSDVVRFDIASGRILDRFNTGTPPLTLKSVLVKREWIP